MDLSPRGQALRELAGLARRGTFDHTDSGVAQLMHIKVLGFDTDEVDNTKLGKAVAEKHGKFTRFTTVFTKAEAAHLYGRLKGSDFDSELLEDLAEVAGIEGEKSDDDTGGDSDDDSPAKPASKPGARPPSKPDVARRFVSKLRGDGGLPVFLAGGAAVTLAGGPREIKDLDFRIDLAADRTFRADDRLSEGLIAAINRLLHEEFRSVTDLVQSDAETGMTIKGHVEGVEVSISRTPQVEYLSHGQDKSGVERLGEFDLILDKAYGFTMRRGAELEKRVTDLIDLLSLIEQQPGRMNVLKGLNRMRGAAYAAQAEKLNARAQKEVMGENLLEEFASALHELLVLETRKVQKLMIDHNAKHLWPLADLLLKTVDGFVANPVQVTVI